VIPGAAATAGDGQAAPDAAAMAGALTAACLAAVISLPAEEADRVAALVPPMLVAGLADLARPSEPDPATS
jgi:hypothetical protein